MEISLESDGTVALLRVGGEAAHADGPAIGQYLRVARENGALRAVVDLSSCPSLTTTVVSVLLREAAAFAGAGGALSVTGVSGQNPFLGRAVDEGTLRHHRSLQEGAAEERRLAAAAAAAAAARDGAGGG